MKYKFLILFLIVFLITTISGATYKQDDCIDIVITSTSSAVNISTLSYPNSSVAITDKNMTSIGINSFKYTFCNTTDRGIYAYEWYDLEGNISNGEFEITYTGFGIDTPKSILYLGFLSILILMFILITMSIPKLPRGNNTDENNNILSINQLKYLRPVFYALSWGILLAIVFISSNIAIAFLPNSMMGDFFFTLYRVMFVLTFPMILIWFVYIFKSIFDDREMKRMLERGVELKESKYI